MTLYNLGNSQRFYLLDLTRTVAALCVVLQHYQHFYFLSYNVFPENFTRSQQPFYFLLKDFYSFGSVAVQFFFTLSGFIFFFIYNRLIYERKISLKNYFILRISRLYPLHILTLIAVMLLQFLYYYLNNKYFIHDSNTFENFILHLFLIQEWRLNTEWSFNAPSWSISVEILLYIFFFFISFIGVVKFSKVLFTFLFLFVLQAILQPKLQNISVGLLCFYSGGIVYFIFEYLKKKVTNNYKLLIIILILDIIVFGRFLNLYFLNFQEQVSYLIGDRIFILLFFIKFPLIILNLALLQTFFVFLGKPLKLLGDISYTIYLIHFPLELVIEILNTSFLNINYDSEIFFVIYFLILFITSATIFKYYENPLKIIIRNKFTNKQPNL